MGELLSKVAERNLCINSDDNVPIPKYHFKCRYDKNDNLSPNQVYTRMKDIFVSNQQKLFIKEEKLTKIYFKRYSVPRDYIKWSVEYLSYNPIEFTSPKILAKDGKNWTDPHMYVIFKLLFRFNFYIFIKLFQQRTRIQRNQI